jgi:hypothetical protein
LVAIPSTERRARLLVDEAMSRARSRPYSLPFASLGQPVPAVTNGTVL